MIRPISFSGLAWAPATRRRMADLRSLRRQRARLAELDAHMLADIGLSRDEAEREAGRPIRDVPEHWDK